MFRNISDFEESAPFLVGVKTPGDMQFIVRDEDPSARSEISTRMKAVLEEILGTAVQEEKIDEFLIENVALNPSIRIDDIDRQLYELKKTSEEYMSPFLKMQMDMLTSHNACSTMDTEVF